MQFGDAGDPGHFVGLDVDGNAAELEQRFDALDVEAHHLATAMIGVIVRDQGTADLHAVRFGDPREAGDVVGGVDDETLAGDAIADEVREVDHLAGDGIGGREIATGQELPEVEAVAVDLGCDLGGVGHAVASSALDSAVSASSISASVTTSGAMKRITLP